MSSLDWQMANQQYLAAAIARVRQALNRHISVLEGDTAKLPEIPVLAPSQLSPPSALEQLCQAFGLSSFERDVLLLCAGMEFEGDWEGLLIAAHGNPQRGYPTFQLALEVLPEIHWKGLLPDSPLRHWRMIELGAGNSLANSALRIDERILHALWGTDPLDERLERLGVPLSRASDLVLSHRQLAEQMANTWLQAYRLNSALPALQLCGSDGESKRAIAAAACESLGLTLYAISAEALPADSVQLHLFRCLCEREWHLSQRVLLLDCDWIERREDERNRAIAQLLEAIATPSIASSQVRRPQRLRPTVTFEVQSPTAGEQRQVWRGVLGDVSASLNGQIDALVSHFNLSATAIQSAYLKVGGWQDGDSSNEEDSDLQLPQFSQRLWTICRGQARPRLDELAQRIDSAASWDDLVLPEKERGVLQDIATHVRQRAQVYERWGFGKKSGRGLGISALFAGGSGTGKTLAAEVLGHQLNLDVYRIDLSSVVSKYIGETEKNLRRVFDAAEEGGVILLFDEADALFGKRTEVKDSHDRHANIEVSYLLQRMESYRGLAILTTNLKSAIDRAFLRRIRFVVQFPFPDASQREAIWQRMFPAQTPTEGLDCQKLAKLNVAGGNIRNIALNAAFIAADAGEPVQMKHVLRAVKGEYVKLERSLTEMEVRGWI
ncbi:ATP-binding protein [Synechococcus sp. PCC 7336]|uniref:ATP-binding protein n=1 Tax=Synechococcus sp. PCC 7336 TaxID=195250 RepID=UPI000346D244|nr:ATP-binding protein [Synechococcus sp. PCC 7336]